MRKRNNALYYDYPKVADLTVDLVLFWFDNDTANVLLIKRGDDSEAFPGAWALPGGYVNVGERLKEAAIRELAEETQIKITNEKLAAPVYSTGDNLIYVNVFDDPNRDPRQRTISNAWTGVLKEKEEPRGTDDAQDAKWVPCRELEGMELAFDHRDIIRQAYLKVLQSGL